MVSIRPATPEDAEAISEIHRLEVVEWRQVRPDGSLVPSRYEDLTDRERLSYGGAWMVPSALRAHLEALLAAGQWTFVAEEDGRLLGEIEVYVGPDPDMGRTAHIDMLEVRKDEQRKGVGRRLVEEVRQRAVAQGCESLTVTPERTAVEFYVKCDLREVVAREKDFELPLGERLGAGQVESQLTHLTSFAPLEHRPLLLGRFQSSFATWLKGWKHLGDPTFLRHEEGWWPSEGTYYRLTQFMRREATAVLQAWVPGPQHLRGVLDSASVRAKQLGYDRITTTVDTRFLGMLEGLEGTVGDESVLLGLKLR
ncbi:MAG: GNAT family N-acetyltransferase [Euryarchaeota archaeon]|nr:GNAT family N-acetyltransferase [Euryarchaeota archaeon]MDE1837482.1 GNAT family N-acetyltransferase [Euryarchaeota archaeon]MDE1880562.1 GNAT family N-acetyltransferase [Euryarchaeota archaeon]MDE2045552.1 GNAT family N-acetyltransferase [Thermoplasmata archaeon]